MKLSTLRTSFANAVRNSPVTRAVVDNAGKLSSVLGLSSAFFLTVNRSWMNNEPVADKMSLSGAALIASSLVLLGADRWPVLKRVSGALGLAYIGYLVADIAGKPASTGLILSTALPITACLSMMFERSAANQNPPAVHTVAPQSTVSRLWHNAVDGFKAAPVFWTGMVSCAMKPLGYLYGQANHEALFTLYTVLGAAENIAVALMDNSVRDYVGLPPAGGKKADTAPELKA